MLSDIAVNYGSGYIVTGYRLRERRTDNLSAIWFSSRVPYVDHRAW